MSNGFYFWTPIGISLFAILQSIAHAWWILYGRRLISCRITIEDKVYFYAYLTYLYGNECDTEALKNNITFNMTTDYFPNSFMEFYTPNGTITEELMQTYLILDSLWIITSVSLLIGILLRIRHCSAVAFFSPWMVVDMATLLLDFFSAIYFGSDLPKAKVKFGEEEERISLNVIMAIVSGKLGIIWITNLVSLFIILKITHKDYHDPDESTTMTRNDSEKRIKSWVLFYGSNSEDDLSYSKTFKDFVENKKNRSNTPSSSSQAAKDDFCSTFKTSTTTIVSSTTPEGSDDRSEKPMRPKKKVQIIDELTGQFPWSYMDPPKKSVENVQIMSTRH